MFRVNFRTCFRCCKLISSMSRSNICTTSKLSRKSITRSLVHHLVLCIARHRPSRQSTPATATLHTTPTKGRRRTRSSRQPLAPRRRRRRHPIIQIRHHTAHAPSTPLGPRSTRQPRPTKGSLARRMPRQTRPTRVQRLILRHSCRTPTTGPPRHRSRRRTSRRRGAS